MKFTEKIAEKSSSKPQVVSVPTPAVRKSKIVPSTDSGKTKSCQPAKSEVKLNTQAKRAQEYELIEAIKDVFDKEGTGFVNAQQLRLLLGSLGNKLSKEEMGVISQFENKNGMVPYEKLLKTVMFE